MMNTLKFTFRNFQKSKVSFSINLIGILFGLTVSSLLFIYVKKELETDNFLENKERIFKINNKNGLQCYESLPRIELFKKYVNQFDDVTAFCGSWSEQDIIYYNEKGILIENLLNTDSSFFNVFQFPSVNGNMNTCLSASNSIVLTQTLSGKIFGDDNPIGKVVELRSTDFGISQFTVSAVIEDVPHNSSIQFTAAIPINFLMKTDWYKDNASQWGTQSYFAFGLLHENGDPKLAEQQLNNAIKEHAPQWVHTSNAPFTVSPFTSIYFNLFSESMVLRHGNIIIVSILGIIGVLILLLAGINYFNLSLSQLKKRYTEFGVKRMLGAGRLTILFQFLFETCVLFAFAGSFMLILFYFFLPEFNSITNSHYTFSSVWGFGNAFLLVCLFISCILIFGFFPAFTLYKKTKGPNIVFEHKKRDTGFSLKNISLTIQFGISFILIAVTLLLQKQNQFMLNSDYGFEKDNIVCIELNDELFPQCDNFRHEISEIQTVQKTALGDRVFGSFDSHWGIALEHKGENKHVVFDMAYVDEHFFDLFNLKIKEGRGFDMNSNKTSQVIFNEELLTRFNVSNIIGSRIKLGNNNGEVIGVVDNFNYSSLRHKINPVGFVCAKESCDKMFVKLTCHDIASTNKTLQQIEMIWKKYSPHFPVNYKFMDDAMTEMYQSEIRFSKLICIASILSLIIAGLGLIGITFKLIETRTKEIGIRKVNGAKLKNVLYLLNADFMKWIVFSFLIAIPVAYSLMNQWLENFAYKTDISWWIFAVSGGIIILIAAITISLQSWRAANRNPVEALRYE